MDSDDEGFGGGNGGEAIQLGEDLDSEEELDEEEEDDDMPEP